MTNFQLYKRPFDLSTWIIFHLFVIVTHFYVAWLTFIWCFHKICGTMMSLHCIDSTAESKKDENQKSKHGRNICIRITQPCIHFQSFKKIKIKYVFLYFFFFSFLGNLPKQSMYKGWCTFILTQFDMKSCTYYINLKVSLLQIHLPSYSKLRKIKNALL